MTSYADVYFLRHLKTINNKLNIISGQMDSDVIQTNYLTINFSDFDRIYCSPLTRCKKTLEILGERTYDASKIIYDNRLSERNMGMLEGKLKNNEELSYPELFIEGSFDVFQTPPYGESFEVFYKRVRKFYNEIICVNLEKDILICAHNQTLKLLRLLIMQKEITYESWSECSFENGKLNLIYSVGGEH